MPEPQKSITLAIVIGLLKHFTETIVGKETVSVIFDALADTTQDTVNGLLGEITGKNEQLRQVLEACQRAEGCFETACTREGLCIYPWWKPAPVQNRLYP